MIKVIIFDWFGVCTVENWADTLGRELSSKLNLDESLVKQKFKPLIQPFARAELSSEQFLEQFIGSLNKNKNPQDFVYLFETIPKVNTELLNYILELKKKYPVFMLSNNFGPVFPNYEKQVDFKKYFDKLFLSHKLKLSKTQDRIWEKILPDIEFKPDELVFIDNKEKYFEPAKKHGIKCILFLKNDQVKKELADLNVKVD
ncbi:HAD hydrolase-like protein [Candidatus Woesearchaeota archaeon]|nr:HAD hydrolase-like protein [Candidatus Woesearchaeota archaeon]